MADMSRWEERYQSNELPWDTGRAEPYLVELFSGGVIEAGRALEVGCGTGTNAVFLARQGCSVTAADISPTAVGMARERAAGEGVVVRFLDGDFLAGLPLTGSFDLVFDRGCWHSFDEPEDRAAFARRVADLLVEGGLWVSLVGSTEGGAREFGPPRRSAADIATAIEPVLELVSLTTVMSGDMLPEPVRMWRAIYRKRTLASVPSSRRP